MLKKEQLEKLLERCMASSCDFAEIFEEEGTTESLSMLNGKLEDTNVLIRAGIGIRLYKGVQSVYGYTNETSEESLKSSSNQGKSYQSFIRNESCLNGTCK